MLRPLFALLLAASPAQAAQVVIEDPCSATPWLESKLPAATGKSVGAVTITALDAAHFFYVGTAAGISSIRNTVTGDAALEAVSDTEMRAYGWCYSLNGVEPNQMPDAVFLTNETDEIRWYFGYAHYQNGAWISYCTPTNQTLPTYICGARP